MMKKNRTMNNLKHVAIVIGIIGLVPAIKAQQMPQTNLYTDNIFNINPAYAGYNSNCLEAYAGHITQWVGIDGAPTTNYLDIHKGMGKRFGIGGGFMLDQTNMINNFAGHLSGSYRVQLSKHQNVRVGLSIGMRQVSINTSNAIVQDPTDEVLAGSTSGITLNNEFGLLYNYKTFLIGVAVPQVIETSAKYDAGSVNAEYNVNRHFTGFMKYDWAVSDKWNIEPSALMKRVTNVNQYDGNLMFTYNDLISVGAGYRTDVGLLARLRLKLKDMFVLGYAYEFAGSNISSYSSGSHEIMLGIRFCKEKIDQPRIESAGPMIEPEPVVEPTPEPVPEPEPVVEPEPTPVIEPAPEPTVVPAPEPTPEPEPVPATITDQERALFNHEVSYSLGESTFDRASLAKIDEMAKVLNKYPNLKLTIIGHSCDIGEKERKQVVSQKRADNIKRYFKHKGVDESRITSNGAGDSNPAVPNSSDENRAKNRRVQFVLSE